MAIFCPLTNTTTVYLACQECEDRLCRKDIFALLVAGTRTYDNYAEFQNVCNLLLKHHPDVLVVSGAALGADQMAARYARERKFRLMEFPADWKKYGSKAGYIRNREMHEYISRFEKRGAILFWDGKSPGTRQSIPLAQQYHTPVRIYHYPTGRYLNP